MSDSRSDNDGQSEERGPPNINMESVVSEMGMLVVVGVDSTQENTTNVRHVSTFHSGSCVTCRVGRVRDPSVEVLPR